MEMRLRGAGWFRQSSAVPDFFAGAGAPVVHFAFLPSVKPKGARNAGLSAKAHGPMRNV